MNNIDPSEASELIHKGLVLCPLKHANHPFGTFLVYNPLDYSFPLMLFQVSLLLIVYRIIRIILKPFKQPAVISQMLSGIILGPSVLSRNGKFRQYVFPDNSDFLIKNIGLIGFMYFLFISGVKMDVNVIKKIGRKHGLVALFGVLIPFCCSMSIALAYRGSLAKETAKFTSIWGIASSLAITAFPVLYPIIQELNLISSEIGRMALSTAMVSDIIGMHGVLIFEAAKQGESRPIAILWFFISFYTVLLAIVVGIQQGMMWIVRSTPRGQQVDQKYVISILLGVLVVGFIADMFGLAIANGPLWLGLAVPDGPPLGAILVEKTETILKNFLLPFSFMYVGMITDVYIIETHWSTLKPLIYMVVVAYTVKLISTFVTARLFDFTTRDSLTLGLIMSLRGEVEFLLFMHWMDFKMVGPPQFTVMVLVTISITAICAPLIDIIYDPTRPYMLNKRCNIQHTPPNTELHIVVCMHDEECLFGLMKLLEVSNPTLHSPFTVYALGLVELVGRANPVFIDHETEEGSINTNLNPLHNTLKIFQRTSGEYIRVCTYTTITTKRSMYQDICELALSKRACLIILPYHKPNSENLSKRGAMNVAQMLNSNVLAHAPCSIGILVDKFPYQNLVSDFLKSSVRHIIVLFLGGADAREALTYADRMAASTDVKLTVIRFLSFENEGDDEMEKKLDDGLVTWFWVKNEESERMVYREVVVKNGEETIAAIQALNYKKFDLWVVGRMNGINPILLEGISELSGKNELGVIGDYVASVDFGSMASVLVVQQQVLRG